jgi:prepilin-type N-terminal cleavage/methylation domain-containing protein
VELNKMCDKEKRRTKMFFTGHHRTIGSSRSRQSGFSLLEMLVVIGVTLVLAATAVPSLVQTIRAQHVDEGFSRVFGEMKLARGLAVNNRRLYKLVFSVSCVGSPTGCLTLYSGTLSTTLAGVSSYSYQQVDQPVPIPVDVTFSVPAGVVDRPEGFGDGITPISFTPPGAPDPNTIFFTPDGRILNSEFGQATTGVVYVSMADNVLQSRAATVWGQTGHIEGFRVVGSNGAYHWACMN